MTYKANCLMKHLNKQGRRFSLVLKEKKLLQRWTWKQPEIIREISTQAEKKMIQQQNFDI